jgi:two-component system cell cycle sensor histidine kinase/response regulator CckA
MTSSVQDETGRADRRQPVPDQARRESDARYRLVAENSRDVIWLLDPKTRRYTYVSPAILELRGLTVAEALAEPITESLTPESLRRVQASLALIGTPEQRTVNTGIYDQPCRDGSIKHVEITTTVIRDDAGKVTEVLGVSRDATARVEAERALAERARFLGSVLETAQDGFWVVDARGQLVDVNPAACAISGFSREELLGRLVSDLDADDRPGDVAARIERIHHGGAERFETHHRRKDGSVVAIEISARLVPDSDGRIVAFLRDVTARNQAAQAQRDGEALLRALTDSLPGPVFLKDRESRWLLANPAALRAVGKRLEEVLGRTDREIFADPRIGEALLETDRQVMASGAVRVVEELVATPQGPRTFLSTKAPYRDATGSVIGLVGHAQDITEQARLREQVEQAKKLESIGRLAGGVAHDFNNLLSVILTYSSALRQELAEGVPPSAEDLDEIHLAAERARDLTRQLLAFARKQVIAPVPLDLNQVVRGSEKLLRRVVGENVTLEVRLAEAPWTIRCDPGQLEQLLVNLTLNARDAMPRGGRITVETLNEEAAPADGYRDPSHPAGRWVLLRVHDEGAGMSPEVMAHLFEPFFTTKEMGRGTGLGLATVHGIVTQSGGHLRVESEPGRGTTFEACFPRSEQPPEPAIIAPPVRARGGSETILVIEDDDQVRRATSRALRDAGYRVLLASGGDEALELAATHGEALHLVVTDVIMPGRDGKTVVEELRRRHGQLKALYVSGYSQEVISSHGVLDRTIDFLPKPFTGDLLRDRVRRLLDGA